MIKKEILFVCYIGKQRSPTARDVFNYLFEKDNLSDEYYASYSSIRFNTRINRKHIQNAYRVIALNSRVKRNLEKKYMDDLEGKLKFLPLPAMRRKNSIRLIKKIEEYYQSKDWL